MPATTQQDILIFTEPAVYSHVAEYSRFSSCSTAHVTYPTGKIHDTCLRLLRKQESLDVRSRLLFLRILLGFHKHDKYTKTMIYAYLAPMRSLEHDNSSNRAQSQICQIHQPIDPTDLPHHATTTSIPARLCIFTELSAAGLTGSVAQP